MRIANQTGAPRWYATVLAAFVALGAHAGTASAAPAIALDIINPPTSGQYQSRPAISDDGRYVAYKHIISNASNIEVFDRITRTNEVVSLNAAGQAATGGSVDSPVISADGRYVLFGSRSPNMDVPVGGGGYFVHDRTTHTTETVVNAAGGAMIGTMYAGMSPNGRYIAYRLRDPADAQNTKLYVRDMVTKTTVEISTSNLYLIGSDGALVSNDGRYVTYRGKASKSGPYELMTHDRVTGITDQNNVNTAGARENAVNGTSYYSMSADGRYVAFTSSSTNLDGADTNGALDVFLRDRVARTTTRISYGAASIHSGNYGSSLSADGRYVTFIGVGTQGGTGGLYRLDRLTNIARRTPLSSAAIFNPVISANGRYISFDFNYTSNAQVYYLGVTDYGPPAALTLSASALDVTEGGAAATYTAVLNQAPTATVTLNITPDAQLSLARSQLTFTTANWNTPQVISVQAINDGVVEGPHSGNVSQKTASADPDFNVVAAANVAVAITDAVIPTIVVPATARPGNLLLTGTAAAGATVVVTVNNLSDATMGAYSAVADDQGRWTLALSELGAGNYEFQAEADGIKSALYTCVIALPTEG